MERELAIEQAHVDLVYRRLAEATRSAQQVASEGRALYQSDRSSFVREEDGTGLYERDVFAFQAAKRLAVLDAEHDGLVFGRLDRTDGEVRYVGRIGVRDADYEPLVIDWRAPAAEPFYRATPSNPMQVVRRRVLRCSGSRVVGIEDDLLDSEADPDLVVLGEGALLAALTRARGHTMRDIVATIQAEQDEAIRAPYQGFTMISGGPGTGQDGGGPAPRRVPALLQPPPLRIRRRLGGGPEPGLHELHRAGPAVPGRGRGDAALDRLGGRRRRQARAANASIPRRSPRSRAACGWSAVLKRLVQEPWQEVPLELSLTVAGNVLAAGRDRAVPDPGRRPGAPQAQPGPRRRPRRPCSRALWRQAAGSRRAGSGRLRRPGAATPPPSPCSATPGGRRSARPTPWPAWPTRRWLARVAGTELTDAQQELLSASYRDRAAGRGLDGRRRCAARRAGPPAGSGARAGGPRGVAVPGLRREVQELVTTMERLAPVREIDPFATAQDTFAHVLVDEAQDITPMQWRMLRRRGPSASWTIVGDPAQSSWPDPRESARAMAELVGTAPVRRFRMSTNYRSPAEVFELAVPGRRAGLPGRRSAAGGALHRTPTRDPYDRRPPAGGRGRRRDARSARGGRGHGRGDLPAVSRSTPTGAALRAAGVTDDRLVVVTALQAKGLEYDGVARGHPGRHRGRVLGRRSDPLRGPDPAHPAADHHRGRGPEEVRPGSATAGSWRRSLGSPSTDSW